MKAALSVRETLPTRYLRHSLHDRTGRSACTTLVSMSRERRGEHPAASTDDTAACGNAVTLSSTAAVRCNERWHTRTTICHLQSDLDHGCSTRAIVDGRERHDHCAAVFYCRLLPSNRSAWSPDHSTRLTRLERCWNAPSLGNRQPASFRRGRPRSPRSRSRLARAGFRHAVRPS
jgi:hypothetical protein